MASPNAIPEAAVAVSKRSFEFHRSATFASLLVGYMGYYLCRQNMSAAFGPMETELGMTPVAFGLISSVGTAFYALGKFASGPVAEALGGRRVFFIGLFGSAAASFVFGLSAGIFVFAGIWAIGRILQSFGWAGLVNVMPRWFSKQHYGTAMGAISTSYMVGGVVTSLVMGGLLSLGVGWRGLFIIPAIMLVSIGLVARFFLKQSPSDVGLDPVEPEPTSGRESEPAPPIVERLKRLVSQPGFLVVCGLSFALTLLREVFNLWMPAYFRDMGASDHMAVFKSVVFPLLGCAGSLFAGWYSDRVSHGRRGPIMITFLVGLIVCLLGLSWVSELSAAIGLESAEVPTLLLVGGAGFFIFGPYSMVGGVVALDFGGRKTAATAAGVLDGVGYAGATLAGVGVAGVVVSYGWQRAFLALAGLSVLSLLLSLPLWRQKAAA